MYNNGVFGGVLVEELKFTEKADLPTGTVTFLLTDVEGSSIKWELDQEKMGEVMMSHDDVAHYIFSKNGGTILKPRNEGDSLFVVFARATDAIVGAVEFQRALLHQPWQADFPVQVRIAIHTGEDAKLRDNDYYGPAVNRCSRVRAIAHGGQILISQATFQLVSDRLPPEFGFIEHGSHRLKDLMRPERVRQISAPGLRTDFPPLASVDVQPNNLPLQLTSFIGRDIDLTRVKRLLESNRLVTLTGAGGTGKTRLSLQVGVEVSENFPDGVWQVELAALTNPDLLLQAVASAMRLDDVPDTLIHERIKRALADRPVLLILDNCEHHVRACATLVVELLSHGPQLKIIVTSREPLNVRGESIYRVPPMSLPPLAAELPIDEIAKFDSIRLFCERAAEHDQDCKLRPENAPDVVELCRRLDGLPLALELAAAHASYLSPRQILDRLSDFLSRPIDEIGVDERHKSMSACIEWSHDTLDEAEKTLFNRLSCFVGGWTLDAAEAVCRDEQISETWIVKGLRNLVSKSLAVSEESLSGDKRFRFLEPVRQFAIGQDGANNEESHRMHFYWFRDYVMRSQAEMGTDRQSYWLHALDADIENIRKSLTSIDATPDDVIDMVITLNEYWNRRGMLRESRHWHEHSVRLGGRSSIPKQVLLLNSLGATAWKQGDWVAADTAFQRAMNLLGLDDVALTCRTRNNIALLAAEAGRTEDARDAFLANLVGFTELKQPLHVGTTLSNLGDIEVQLGNFDLAIDYLDRAIQTFRELGNQAKVSRASANQAYALTRIARYEEALHRFEDSFLIWQTVTDWPFIGEGLNDLAWLCSQLDEHESVLRLIGASQSVLKFCGSSLSRVQQEIQEQACKAAELGLGRSKTRSTLEKSRAFSPQPSVRLALEITRALATQFATPSLTSVVSHATEIQN